MKRIRLKIEKIMDESDRRLFSISTCLLLLSFVFRGILEIRNLLYQWGILRAEKLPCKVVSIGNLCAGGTGKTPMAVYTAKLLADMGYRVAVVSRGYKGKAEKAGGIVSNGKNLLMDAQTAGDEPFMMAEHLPDIPVIVGKNRYLAGKEAISSFHVNVVVLDDAFQHRRLKRDIDLVLLDFHKPFGNGRLLPAGKLREPLKALCRSDGVVLTRSEKSVHENRRKNILHVVEKDGKRRPIFFTSHASYLKTVIPAGANKAGAPACEEVHDITYLKGKKVFVFSGIANNTEFRDALEGYDGIVSGFEAYADHHAYTASDFGHIIYCAMEKKADIIATTEKDYAKMPEDMAWPVDLAVMGVRIIFEEGEAQFRDFLDRSLC